MKTVVIHLLLAAFLCSCKKSETPLHSGTITYYHEVNGKIVSEVYIPSAFTPGSDGINDVYRPILRGCSYQGYRMDIANMYQQNVFLTQDINLPWDGMYKGMQAPTGKYIYQVKAIDTTGYVYTITNSFFLLR